MMQKLEPFVDDDYKTVKERWKETMKELGWDGVDVRLRFDNLGR